MDVPPPPPARPAAPNAARSGRFLRSALGVLRREAEITWRMMVDNLTASVVPPLMITAAASSHYRADAAATLCSLAWCLLLHTLYQYVFDASNQARSLEEDRVNKPWRPLPHALTTGPGLLRRLWIASVLYILLGVFTHTLIWVLLWQTTVIVAMFASPRHYIWQKPLWMVSGMISHLAAGWRLAGPIDRTGWTWICTLTILLAAPLRFEDVRDMDGDRAVERRTLPLVIGHWPVRIMFAVFMAAAPIPVHLLLYAPGNAGRLTGWSCDAALAAVCWTAAARSLLLRTTTADRTTYLMLTAVYGTALAGGIVILRA
ncbi:UbiA family prenyltransferase [Streptomyces sp. NPDC004126]|uniref:UbiA family prenyltransferase n=1 Tax=Streptomyces sp. NPDC004126 TaxID=3390695 RepID=UPI003D04189F